MKDCLFCKIIQKEINAYLIYEDNEVISFLDIYPRSLGHSVVIPKFHCSDILQLPEEKEKSLLHAVKKVTLILKNSLKPDGFTIGINHGKVAGQAIDHLHFHIIPRWENDGGGSLHGVVNNISEKSIEEAYNLIIEKK